MANRDRKRKFALNKTCNNKTRAFTLIELLVVIAMIGLLASIVLIYLRGPRERARVASGMQFQTSIHHTLGAYAVGVWNLDDPADPTQALDTSGFNNHGTLIGSPIWGCSEDPNNPPTPYHVLGQGQNKCSLEFNGAGECVYRASVTQLDRSALTFTFWSKQVGTRSFYMHPIGLFGGHRATIYVAPNTYRYSYKFSDIDGVRHEGVIATLNDKWHFFAVTFNGGEIEVHIDGRLEVTRGASGEITGGDTSVFIATTGTGSSPSGNWFSGPIDEVRVYSWALATGEIQKIYVQTAPKHQ
jgi:prepilin-type N-terminal cleavage/methylation domain-containing protein